MLRTFTVLHICRAGILSTRQLSHVLKGREVSIEVMCMHINELAQPRQMQEGCCAMHRVAVLHDLMYLGLVWAQPPAAHPATVSAESCRARTKVSHL